MKKEKKKKFSVFPYLKGTVHYYFLSFLGLILSLVSSSLAPYFMGELVDKVIGKEDSSLFWPLLILMSLSFAFTGIFHYVEEFSSDHISKAVARNLSLAVFKKIQKEDGTFFLSRSPGDLMSRCADDANHAGFSFGFCLIYFFECIGIVIAMTLGITFLSIKVALIPLFVVPIIAFITIKVEMIGDGILSEISDKKATLNEIASEAITGIRTVKSFGKEEKEERKLNCVSLLYRDLNTKLDKLWANYEPAAALSKILLYLIALYSGYLVVKHKLTLGEFTAIFQYSNQLIWPMMEIGWIIAMLAQGRASLKKLKAILIHPIKIESGNKKLKKTDGKIEFKDVSVSFDGKIVLDNISFTLERGRSLAIMGATGSGKSLIASLIMRFIDPNSGEITIDGINIKDIELKEVREFSSLVSQETFLFSDSVAANLRLGKEEATDNELMAVSYSSEAHSFITKLKDGYSTVIGERGKGLSGGQKQRLSIARAFLKRSGVLILDDATSALDMETERNVEEEIRKIKGTSLVIIAHRITAVKDADEIIILENGRIAERGDHKTLLKKKGLYWNTYISQFPEDKDA